MRRSFDNQAQVQRSIGGIKLRVGRVGLSISQVARWCAASLPLLLRWVVVATSYFVVAKGSLALASLHPSASPVWPPSGLALAVLLVWGNRLWPAIAAGAFLANATTLGSLSTSSLIAAGNTLEALMTAALLERLNASTHPFEGPSQVVLFACLTLLPGTMVSATVGVGGLVLAGFADPAQFSSMWLTWWLGDVGGLLILTPFIVLWAKSSLKEMGRAELQRLALLLGATIIVGLVAFSPLLQQTTARGPLAFVAIAPLLWAALRHNQRDTATIAFMLSAFAIWGTLSDGGPFARPNLNDSFLLTMAFVISTAVPSLVLSADVAVRRLSEERHRALVEHADDIVADAAPVLIWMSGVDKLCTWFNKPWLDFVGRTMERELGNGWSENVHSDDFERCLKTYVEAFDARQPFSMEYRLRRHDGEYRWVLDYGIPRQPAGKFAGYIGSCVDITERKQAEDQKSFLVAELDHRVKNTLACVAAIAEQTRATSNSIDEFLDVLRGRIRSLANTHGLLSANRWRDVDLGELVRGELAPCMKDGNTLIDGPAVGVTADSVQAVAIVLHELTTNAAKYGALSNDSGRISVQWHWQPHGGSCDSLILEWCETGGPPVVAPSVFGYGTSVIRGLIPYELGGTVDYALATDGVRCKLEIPAKWLSKKEKPTRGLSWTGERLDALS
jgi:PAS domain S-box-containing protein